MFRTLQVHKDDSGKLHLAKRINHPMWGRMYTAFCDTREKGWYCSVGDEIYVRDIPERIGCLKCIRLAGYEEARQKYELIHGRKNHMPPIQIDFEGVSDSQFPVLEEGSYAAVITAIHSKTSKAGKPMLEFEFNIPSENNRKMWRYYSLQPNALWALKQLLTRLEIAVPDGVFELDEAELIGQPVTLSIGQKEHWKNPGELDNEILDVFAASSSDW